MAAQWRAQQPPGLEGLQQDPYYEAFPGTPDVYFPAAPTAGTQTTSEYQKKSPDDYSANSWCLFLLRVCAIGIVLLVCSLIAFVMLGGSRLFESSHPTTTTETASATSLTSPPPLSTIRQGPKPRTEPTEPSVTYGEIYTEGGYAVAVNDSQYGEGHEKVLHADEVLESVPLNLAPRHPRKPRGRATTARRKRTSRKLK
ncbi:uncharacterized protein [Dermacentor andersoni]|uniref:uncharacterized protein n=1 Tax=Dermacentor andersoni TaxID=34620 RepID=UPI0024179378|nr:uncharacterized protein LOC129387789 [Dermacentor andersoni]